MGPSIQVVLNFVAGLFSDLFGLGAHHRDEHRSRHGIPPCSHLPGDTWGCRAPDQGRVPSPLAVSSRRLERVGSGRGSSGGDRTLVAPDARDPSPPERAAEAIMFRRMCLLHHGIALGLIAAG